MTFINILPADAGLLPQDWLHGAAAVRRTVRPAQHLVQYLGHNAVTMNLAA